MLPYVGWKVYCENGEIYTSDPESIPDTVQVIMYYHEKPYRTTEHGLDYYNLEGHILYGKEIHIDKFMEILDTAMNDMEWPNE
jgi:hypothetical protein